MFNNYVHNLPSKDHHRNYMLRFLKIASEFKNYQLAVQYGGMVMMEFIQNTWIGVHLLVGKYKCVENYLNAIDLEY